MSETIKQKIERARKAFDEISDYTQEQVDKLIYEAGKIIYKNAAKLAEMAVNETGLGDVNEKILKNEETGAVFWEYLKDKKLSQLSHRLQTLLSLHSETSCRH